MEVINPQLKELERKQEELRSTVDYMRGEFEELRRTARDTSRQTIWQFIIFTITMATVMLGGLKYQADVLRREMDIHFNVVNERFDVVNERFKGIDQRFDAMEKRIEQSEKNVLARFDDLKQEVRASRK
ncbi:MAG: hypothetical protein J2P41_19930 [Blastocatellia bacterium]|nr:hypothetical protein [Blastocatellia bacterium]